MDHSVVIVSCNGDFCSGFVVHLDPNYTYVVTCLEFVSAQNSVNVRFWDGIELPATIVNAKPPFALLRAANHDCESIQWVNEPFEWANEPLQVCAPFSLTSYSAVPSRITLPSIDSYTPERYFIPGSDRFFLVTCPFTFRTFQGIPKIISAPVFTMRGRALGIICEECRTGKPDAFGAEMKVVLSANYVIHYLPALP